MRDGSGNLLGSFGYRNSGSIGGGQVTGLNIADDGTLVARNDIYNCHIFDAGGVNGREFIRVGDNITESGWTRTTVGNWDICIAATDSNYIYAIIDGCFWATSDKAATITKKTAFTRNSVLNHSNAFRAFGNRMRVDPAGTQIVGVMDMSGLKYTLDGGGSFTQHPDIPSWSTNLWGCIEFGRGSTVVSGKTQEVFVAVPGSGIWRSSTGITGTFSLLASSPTDVVRLKYAAGKLFICRDQPNQLQTWTSAGGFVTPTGTAYGRAVVINPNDTTKVFAAHSGGFPSFISTDTGGAFTTFTGAGSDAATDVPWLAVTAQPYGTVTDAVWDKSRNRIYISDGVGLFYIDTPPTTSSGAVTRTSCTNPIRQLITQGMLTRPSDGRLFVTHQDRTIFTYDRATAHVPASTHGVDLTVALVHGGSGIDYAIDNENYIVCTHVGLSGASYSTAGGFASWQRFAAYPAGSLSQGAMACGNQGNIIWVPSFWNAAAGTGGTAQYTTNGGTSWTQCSFGGNAAGGHASFLSSRIPIVADKQNPGTFYFYPITTNNGDATDLALKGLWKTTDNGATWTRVKTGYITTYGQDVGDGKLRMAPGKSPHIFWCCGQVNSSWDAPTPDTFLFSNGGATWTAIPGISEVADYAFGKAAYGRTYPAIYAIGWVGGVYGVWAMFDFNPTTVTGNWVLMTHYPKGSDSYFNVMAADMGKFGRHYVGGSTGQVVGDYSYSMSQS